MKEKFDVIVVGARCAGSPLAASLAAKGLRVCLLDRARFPSEVPSTHMIHPSGVARLGRLGLLDELLATGAPPLERGGFVIDDVRLELDQSVAALFEAPWLCIRRSVLDALLVKAASAAGAEVRTEIAVTGLVHDAGRVSGVQTEAGPLMARLVVGADGPHSAIARFTGAREYHVTAPGRMFLWAYFEGAAGPPGHATLGRVGDIGFLAMATDSNLFLAGVAVSMALRDTYMADVERRFTESLLGIEELAEILCPATRVGRIRVMARWHGYFREATGPGWVLVGDAGHFKDPTPAQGISDALRQAEKLTTAIESGLGGGELPAQLAAWWRWRDEDAWEMYWFAADMGATGPNSRIVTEMFRGLSRERRGTERFLRVLNHETRPSKLFSTGRGLRTIAGAGAKRPMALPGLVSDAREVLAGEARRQRLRRRPEFSDAAPTAMPTPTVR